MKSRERKTVQRKPLKELLNPWRTIAQISFSKKCKKGWLLGIRKTFEMWYKPKIKKKITCCPYLSSSSPHFVTNQDAVSVFGDIYWAVWKDAFEMTCHSKENILFMLDSLLQRQLVAEYGNHNFICICTMNASQGREEEKRHVLNM